MNLSSTMQINSNRLKERFQVSSSIGATKNKGLTRLALSEEDRLMRNIFVGWLEEIGLRVTIDQFGNIFGRLNGLDDSLSPVLMGSHLDSQPNGGRFDGVLGVLGALEVLQTFKDHGITPLRPVEVVNFTNEEGARFVPSMLGSGGFTGIYDEEFIYSRLDSSGLSFRQALETIGFKGDKVSPRKNIHAYVELHIEQGPILENTGYSIGIVEGVQGLTCLEVTLEGSPDHAGTTPMEDRKDALAAFSNIHQAILSIYKDFIDARITVGKISVQPNVTNSIPGTVVFTVDLRHYQDSTREQLVQEVETIINRKAKEHSVEFHIKKLIEHSSIRFSQDVKECIKNAVDKLGYDSRSIISGAGHDAQHMQSFCSSGMIFVPSKNGKSHCEEEFTDFQDMVKGVNTLLYTIHQLANQQDIIHT